MPQYEQQLCKSHTVLPSNNIGAGVIKNATHGELCIHTTTASKSSKEHIAEPNLAIASHSQTALAACANGNSPQQRVRRCKKMRQDKPCQSAVYVIWEVVNGSLTTSARTIAFSRVSPCQVCKYPIWSAVIDSSMMMTDPLFGWLPLTRLFIIIFFLRFPAFLAVVVDVCGIWTCVVVRKLILILDYLCLFFRNYLLQLYIQKNKKINI